MKLYKTIDFSPPWKLWLFVWSTVFGFFALRIVSFYSKPTLISFLYICTSSLVFLLLHLFLNAKYKYRRKYRIHIDNGTLSFLKRFAKKYLTFWLLGNTITIVIQKGFPLLWMLLGSSKSYADFGFPTFQGFLNSLYSFSLIIYFLNYYFFNKKSDLIIIILLLFYPIIIMSRGLLVLVIIEIAGVYFLFNKLKLIHIFKGALFVFLFIYIFGMIGDFRLGFNTEFLNNLINPEYTQVFHRLPSGFFWVYLYGTSSFNNLVSNLSTVHPLYKPYYTISPLLPSVLRNIFYDTNYSTRYALEMANNSFNTFTVFANFLKDFGIVGSLIAFIPIQYLSTVVYIKAKRNEIWAILAYPVIFACIILSIFTNYFTVWFSLFQIILAVHIQKKYKKIIKYV